MDTSDPTKSITATLDGPVLAALASAGRAMSVAEVAELTPRGSELGVRKSLGRLVEQGTVIATEIGNRRIYELNREHIAAPIAELLSELRLVLWERMRKEVRGWRPAPIYACVFGSAARGEGSTESDIDILLVHAPRPGERYPKGTSARSADPLLAIGEELFSMPLTVREMDRWISNVDRLRESVRLWTGNHSQIVEMSAFEWRRAQRQKSPLSTEIQRDAVDLFDRRVLKLGRT